MKYMLLLHNTFGEKASEFTQEMVDAEIAAHGAFAGMVASRGGVFHGEALESPTTARTIRKDAEGNFVVTDGPFAELKDQIGGYYVLEAGDMDEAVELAKHCPAYAGIEVRPIWDIPGQ